MHGLHSYLSQWLSGASDKFDGAKHASLRPTLAVGQDGVYVPMRHGVWQEGATAMVFVFDRRGWRLGTVQLG